MPHDLSFEAVRLGELPAFARHIRSRLDRCGLFPITVWKADSLALNPNARPNDLALVIVRDGERIVGYVGFLAGVLMKNGVRRRIQFGTTILIDPNVRGQGLAQRMVNFVFEHDDDYVLVGNSRSAERFLGLFGYPSLRPYRLHAIKFDRFSTALRARGILRPSISERAAQHSSPVLRTLAALASRATDLRALEVKSVSRLGEDAGALRERPRPYDRFHRDIDTVNWMIEHPWILPASTADSEAARAFYFASVRDEFFYRPYELLSDRRVAGFLVFQHSVKDGYRSVRLVEYEESEVATRERLFALSMLEAKAVGARSLDLPGEIVPKGIHGFFPNLLGRSRERRSFFHPAREATSMSDPLLIVPQMSDADTGFS